MVLTYGINISNFVELEMKKKYEMFGKKNFDLHRKTWCGEEKVDV